MVIIALRKCVHGLESCERCGPWEPCLRLTNEVKHAHFFKYWNIGEKKHVFLRKKSWHTLPFTCKINHVYFTHSNDSMRLFFISTCNSVNYYVGIKKLLVNIIMLHVDITYLACKWQKYATMGRRKLWNVSYWNNTGLSS